MRKGHSTTESSKFGWASQIDGASGLEWASTTSRGSNTLGRWLKLLVDKVAGFHYEVVPPQPSVWEFVPREIIPRRVMP